MTSRTIAVLGATGTQGSGLVRAIFDRPGDEYAVRALTRDPHSAKAQELAAAGAEVVAADLEDESSLRKAFDGAYGVFVVTNYFAAPGTADNPDRTAAEMEVEQAGNAARAARDAGVRHVIWSTLDDTRPHFGDDDRVPSLDDGRYKVPHFDAKSEADDLFAQYGVPTTFLRTTFYYESLSTMPPVRDADGKLVLTLPMADRPLAAIAADDIGRTALALFERGSEYVGKTVSIAGDHLTGHELAAALTEALGEEVRYAPYSWDEFRALGFHGAVEFGNMFQYYAENSEQFTGARDLAAVRALNPRLRSFRDWLAEHHAEILG